MNNTGCVDFDGVIYPYDGTYAPVDDSLKPIEGAIDFLNETKDDGWDVVVLSARASAPMDAMSIMSYIEGWDGPCLAVTAVKPAATWYLDDRGLAFAGPGKFPTMQELKDFRPWWDARPSGADLAAEAAQIRASAEWYAVSVTPRLENVVTEAGGYLTREGTMLKPINSILAKLQDGGEVLDGLRYTAVFQPNDYVSGIDAVMGDLESDDFSEVRARNYWLPTLSTDGIPAGTYAGVHIWFRNPAGYVFEVQFHTPDSLAAVTGNDVMFRMPGEKVIATDAMRQAIARVPAPPGIMSLVL